jgi:site-specific DNA-methyltransferase (adenine-specific)
LKDEWQGWGTALKPAHEPICVARKPLIGTVANNVLTYGTGALNIDGSRVGTETLGGGTLPNLRDVGTMSKEATGIDKLSFGQNPRPATRLEQATYEGRWPANVIHDGSDEVLKGFPNEAGRFFYCAKASKSERNAGLDGLEEKAVGSLNIRTDAHSVKNGMETKPAKNFHPTVKPIALMRYLIKLVTPPNGVVLDPFLGSGSTAVAAILEGFDWIGCEMTEDYFPIIEAKVAWAHKQGEGKLL